MFEKLRILTALVMLVQRAPASSEYCQRIIFPVFPLSTNVPLLATEHTVSAPEIVPPAERGLTVIVAAVAFVAGQLPLVIDAL